MKTTLSKEDAIILLKARDATQELFSFSKRLIGANTMGEGIIAAYAALDDVLWHGSSYFDPDLNFEETEFFTILESDLSVEEKVEKLFP